MSFFHIPFARRMPGISDSAFHALGTATTQFALQEPGLSCAIIDEILIRTFLARFVETGRLEPSSEMEVVEWQPCWASVLDAQASVLWLKQTAATSTLLPVTFGLYKIIFIQFDPSLIETLHNNLSKITQFF